MSHNKKTLYSCLAVFVMLAVVVATAWGYVNKLNGMLKEENYEYLEEIAVQGADAISNKISGDMFMLRGIAVMLGNLNTLDVLHWIESFNEESLFDEFQRIGIILPNGMGYGYDVNGVDFSDREYFKQAMLGNHYLSDVLVDRITNDWSCTYAVPIYNNNTIIGVLAAVTNVDTFQKTLFDKPFMGKGYTYIIKNTGEPMVYSKHPDSEKQFNNFFDVISGANQAEIDAMKNNMLKGSSGRFEYYSGDKLRLLSYAPLEINNWYAISVVPDEVVEQKSGNILHLTMLSAGVVCIVCFIYNFSIIFIQFRSKKKLSRLAYYDELTNIGNKNLFFKEVPIILDDTRFKYAYCIFDIKRFSAINERFGYSKGDDLLKHIANVLTADINENEQVAHFSADIFHLLLRYENIDELEQRLNCIVDEIGELDFITDYKFHIYARFGIYIVEDTSIELDAMGDMAKLALNKIRDMHRACCSFYTEDLQMIEEQEIENSMQMGLDNNEFKLYMQPKYSLVTGKIAGAEVLVRWLHPERGLIPPIKFIPFFEKCGFISELDLYMFEHLCQTIKRWMQEGRPIVPISINQSRMNLYVPDYIDKLRKIFYLYNIPPEYIVIEITESAFFNDTTAMIKMISSLHDMGFKISMDDFGSGYSSLNMLQEIYLNELKIDKNFFNQTADTKRGKTIVRNIISMASELDMDIIAEGVETLEQVDFLRETNCHLVQGYYFARPMPCSEFEELIKKELG